MTCAEFQRVLPYIIETGGNAEEEQHLRDCRICSDLVQDLRYIAEQAKLLVPMEDPSPQVWDGIRGSLEREGLVKKPARARGRLLGHHTFPWIASVVAALVVLSGFVLYHHGNASVTASSEPAPGPSMDAQDQAMLQRVVQSRPAMRDAYAHDLKMVNASIRESRRAVEQDPSDTDARDSLQRAYDQKNMLYQMASRPLQ